MSSSFVVVGIQADKKSNKRGKIIKILMRILCNIKLRISRIIFDKIEENLVVRMPIYCSYPYREFR